jgi:hypothetical protein
LDVRQFRWAVKVFRTELQHHPRRCCLALAAKKETPVKQQGGQITASGRETRQGFRDRPVLLVLVISLTLAAVVLGLVWGGFFGS